VGSDVAVGGARVGTEVLVGRSAGKIAVGAMAVSVLLTPVAITVCLGAQAAMNREISEANRKTCFTRADYTGE
jgi:hypothetical protein